MHPIVACPDGPLARRVEKLGIETSGIRGTDGSLRLHPIGTPRAILQMSRAARQVRRLAAHTEADLIHANSIRAGLIATAAASQPTVVHVRDCLPPGRASALSLRAISRADALIANSEYTRSTLEPHSSSARVVHNAVHLSRFENVRLTPAEARLRLGLDKRGPVLAVIAQITPWKGQDDAIRIASELIASYPKLKLLIVGSPKFTNKATRYNNTAYFESLGKQVRARSLTESVHFMGERDDVPQILRAVDLVLVPSWEEPFGRTIIEAMAAGVPVAATNVGGPPEILGETGCGLLLPPRQPTTWAAAINRLLAQPERLSEMGRRSKEITRGRFAIERHVRKVIDVYQDTLTGDAVPAA